MIGVFKSSDRISEAQIVETECNNLPQEQIAVVWLLFVYSSDLSKEKQFLYWKSFHWPTQNKRDGTEEEVKISEQ